MESTFKGKRALDEIAARNALLDGRISSVEISSDDGETVLLTLTCVPRESSPVRELRLTFSGVVRFDLGWMDEDAELFYFVPAYTALRLATGTIYLSLDPYDDTEELPDERDNHVIEARQLTASFLMKE